MGFQAKRKTIRIGVYLDAVSMTSSTPYRQAWVKSGYPSCRYLCHPLWEYDVTEQASDIASGNTNTSRREAIQDIYIHELEHGPW